MAVFTLRQAALEVGVDKMQIQRAIKRGDLSARRDGPNRPYRIDAAELFRVFPQNVETQSDETSLSDTLRQTDTPSQDAQILLLQREIEMRDKQIDMLETERKREREQASETIEDLRERLTIADKSRRQLTYLITDQSTKKYKGLFSGLFRPS
ncbi:MAG: hypothetical protein AAF224_13630 [Pseudomonadota bacterium]